MEAQQVELLEDEADAPVAHLGQRGLAHVADVLAGQVVATRRRDVETAEDVHEGRLARTRGPHDGDVLALFDGQADAPEGGHADGAGPVDLGHLLQLDHRVPHGGVP